MYKYTLLYEKTKKIAIILQEGELIGNNTFASVLL